MKLHRGRQNVTLWLKPEHVEALDRLATKDSMNLSPFLIDCIAYAIDHGFTTAGRADAFSLASNLRSDVAARQHRVPAQFDI